MAARAASALLASVLASRNDAFDPGEVADAGSRATPLGDAAPFEYGKRAAGDDVFSIAARGVSESHEAECHSEYEIDMQQCDALAFHMGGARMSMLCKQNAFDRYQQCRGY
jgi:hypothetical protein